MKQYVVVFDLVGVKNYEKKKVCEEFTDAYNQYCEVVNEMIPMLNGLWNKFCNELGMTDDRSVYENYMGAGFSGVAGCMTEMTKYGKMFDFFVDPEGAQLKASLKNRPDTLVSFHLEERGA